jgi:crotonobetainyl-CoA:carnitine CoA-transferase CaiB-like acyl-CoA transferase
VDNRSKRAAELDLRDPEAFAAFHKLLEGSDVFVSNYRLAALRRLGLDPDTIRAKYPSLVMCVVTGYGSTGPEKDTAGYDMAAFWARSGAADSFRPESTEFSSLIPGGFGDHSTALSAAGGIAAALVKAAKTGEGSLVETSLLRTGLYANSWPIAYQMANGGEDVQSRIDQKQRPFTPIARHYGNPLSGLYKTSEGVQVYLIGADAIRRECDHFPSSVASRSIVDRSVVTRRLAQHRRGARPAGVVRGWAVRVCKGPAGEWRGAVRHDPVGHTDEDVGRLGPDLPGKRQSAQPTRIPPVTSYSRADPRLCVTVWFAKVQSVQEVIDDEQVDPALLDLPPSAADIAAAERENVLPADLKIRTVASPVDFNSSVSQPRLPVPAVGEHTGEILTEAGVDAEVVERILQAAAARTQKLAEAKAADPQWKPKL